MPTGPCDLIGLALAEDLGTAGDVTSAAFISEESRSTAMIVARGDCVVAGTSTAVDVFHRVDPTLQVTLLHADGEELLEGEKLLEVFGSTRAILAAERTALNFLGRLCGIATLSRRYANAVRESGVVLLDTRKTTPGWRLLEKAAVRAGGCINHRLGLHDAVLVKDNHLAALGDLDLLPGMLQRLRVEHPGLPIEVEADTRHQVEQFLEMSGIDVLLLDNMTPPEMASIVELRNKRASDVLLEASGGVTLDSLHAIVASGVDRISVGALTHSAGNADLSLEIRNEGA